MNAMPKHPAAAARQTVRVPMPSSGEHIVHSPPGGILAFDFDPAQAVATRASDDLVFGLDGGGIVVVKDFFVAAEKSHALPTLILPGAINVEAEDFLAAFNIAISPAAGLQSPTGQFSEGGGGYLNMDDAETPLIGGIDRLEALDTGVGYGGDSGAVPRGHRNDDILFAEQGNDTLNSGNGVVIWGKGDADGGGDRITDFIADGDEIDRLGLIGLDSPEDSLDESLFIAQDGNDAQLGIYNAQGQMAQTVTPENVPAGHGDAAGDINMQILRQLILNSGGG